MHKQRFSLKPGEAKSLAAQLASRQAFRQSGIELKPVHADLRISIERSGGRPVLRLRTTRRVDEPFVETLIELRSNASSSLSRYTVLLDPLEYKAPSTVPATTQTQKPARPETPAAVEKPAPMLSREDLFGVPRGEGAREPESKPVEWRGFAQNTLAYDYQDPRHWSRAVIRTQLGEGRHLGMVVRVVADRHSLLMLERHELHHRDGPTRITRARARARARARRATRDQRAR